MINYIIVRLLALLIGNNNAKFKHFKIRAKKKGISIDFGLDIPFRKRTE